MWGATHAIRALHCLSGDAALVDGGSPDVSIVALPAFCALSVEADKALRFISHDVLRLPSWSAAQHAPSPLRGEGLGEGSGLAKRYLLAWRE
ncbi:hypothetical protein GCM10007863_35500 [Dyella mobilis]|nr:hypothetical protein GCM10007863_35500 [Dyella mobilis]